MQNQITREQAVEIVGEANVGRVERENCEPTGRVGVNGACQGDDLCEWSASVSCMDVDGIEATLVAYYYTTNEQDQLMADTGDGGSIDWKVDHYAVI